MDLGCPDWCHRAWGGAVPSWLRFVTCNTETWPRSAPGSVWAVPASCRASPGPALEFSPFPSSAKRGSPGYSSGASPECWQIPDPAPWDGPCSAAGAELPAGHPTDNPGAAPSFLGSIPSFPALPVASSERSSHFLHHPEEGVDVSHKNSFAFQDFPAAAAGIFCKGRSSRIINSNKLFLNLWDISLNPTMAALVLCQQPHPSKARTGA